MNAEVFDANYLELNILINHWVYLKIVKDKKCGKLMADDFLFWHTLIISCFFSNHFHTCHVAAQRKQLPKGDSWQFLWNFHAYPEFHGRKRAWGVDKKRKKHRTSSWAKVKEGGGVSVGLWFRRRRRGETERKLIWRRVQSQWQFWKLCKSWGITRLITAGIGGYNSRLLHLERRHRTAHHDNSAKSHKNMEKHKEPRPQHRK